MDSAAPSPAASLREQIATAIEAAIKDGGPSPAPVRGTRIKAYDAADAVLALPALREAAAPAPSSMQHVVERARNLAEDLEKAGHDTFALRAQRLANVAERTAAPAQVDALADLIEKWQREPVEGQLAEVVVGSLLADFRYALRARSASPAPAITDAEILRASREQAMALVHDWPSYRDALDKVFPDYQRLSEPAQNWVWTYTVAVVNAYVAARRPPCLTCKKDLDWGETFRCADCRGTFCARCIRPHFASTSPATAHAAASPAPTQPEGSETRETLEVASLPDPSGLPNAQNGERE